MYWPNEVRAVGPNRSSCFEINQMSTIPPFFQKQLKKEIGFPNETDAYRICGCFRRRDHGDSNGSGSHHNLYHNCFLNG